MKKIFLTALAGLSFASAALAQTEITITGATAFRSAATTAIANAFDGTPDVAYISTSSTPTIFNSTYGYFRGNFPGIGDTIIRTSWTGSVEGVRDIVGPNNVTVILNPPSTAPFPGVNVADTGNGQMLPRFAFSDVEAANTPFGGAGLSGGPCGVIVFCLLAQEGSPAALNNITQQQLRALVGQGYLPLSIFTGDNADDDEVVVWTGRYDGSGTRTSYLAECGYGFDNLVQQFKGTVTSGTISRMQVWPLNDGDNRSLIWNPDTIGNGGYVSGGTIANLLGNPTSNVQGGTEVVDADGFDIFDPQPAKIHVVSYLGTGDTNNAITNGARLLTWNGQSFNPAAPFSDADKAKVANGQYSAWNFQQLYYRTAGVTTQEQTVYDALLTAIGPAVEANGTGIALSTVGNTSRATDGAPILP